MKLKVLGSGCPTCKALYERVKEVVAEMQIEEEVEYVSDINKLVEEGIATSPAFKINGEVACAASIDRCFYGRCYYSFDPAGAIPGTFRTK
jgi:small redox-active disulfide protein 2